MNFEKPCIPKLFAKMSLISERKASSFVISSSSIPVSLLNTSATFLNSGLFRNSFENRLFLAFVLPVLS